METVFCLPFWRLGLYLVFMELLNPVIVWDWGLFVFYDCSLSCAKDHKTQRKRDERIGGSYGSRIPADHGCFRPSSMPKL
jgi:hypothetical protein